MLEPPPTSAVVLAVQAGPSHGIGKPSRESIRLVVQRGVEGDAHFGETVQHLSRIARDPTQPNFRQVHLIHRELHEELRARGFTIEPGQMGENVTTRGLDLLSLPLGTHLRLGDEAEIELTGLRNPCRQLDQVQPGLMAATLAPGADGARIYKAGVMAVVLAGGQVRPGDPIAVIRPLGETRRLAPV